MATVQTHYRACHLCEAICGLEIQTRGKQVISIKGDPKDPLSRGHICPKATAIQDIHEDPDRLRRPIKRIGDQWIEISWEEAYKLVAQNLVDLQRDHGDDAVAFYAGNPSIHHYGTMTHGRLLRKAIRTRNHFSATSLDQLPHHLAALQLFGHQMLLPIPDLDNTHFLLMLGANPLASNGSMMTAPDVRNRLKAIQNRGGRLVVIDPRHTATAKLADQHHFIQPGSDAFLLLALIHTFFKENLIDLGHLKPILDGVSEIKTAVQAFTPELAAKQTGISAETIRGLAREFAQAPTAVCYGRMGVSTQSFGGICQWAICLINILTGNMDAVGGALFSQPAFGYVDASDRAKGSFDRYRTRVRNLPEFGSEFPSATLAEEILTQGSAQIKGLITIAGNPVLSSPNGRQLDHALSALDFMVSIDIYVNETTRHAHVILPPTDALEHDHYDLVFAKLAVRNIAKYSPAVFEPSKDSQHDWQIFNALSQQISALKGQDFKPLPAPHILLDHGLKKGRSGLDLGKLIESKHGVDLGPLQPTLLERICTENGRINLASKPIMADLNRLRDSEGNAELVLIGRRHLRSNNSWMHNVSRLVKGKPRWHLFMHPEDMAKRKIRNGDRVCITSNAGQVETKVSESKDVMPGVVSLPHGWGHQRPGVKLRVAAQQGGVSINDLSDELMVDELTGNAVFNGVPVKVELA